VAELVARRRLLLRARRRRRRNVRRRRPSLPEAEELDMSLGYAIPRCLAFVAALMSIAMVLG
jgi:hypothetical protein